MSNTSCNVIQLEFHRVCFGEMGEGLDNFILIYPLKIFIFSSGDNDFGFNFREFHDSF